MSAAKALATAEAAGIRFSVVPGGGVRMVANQPPPPGLVVELRRYREDVALLLATREGYADDTHRHTHAAHTHTGSQVCKGAEEHRGHRGHSVKTGS